MKDEITQDTFSDDMFSIKVSDNMEIRNLLRSGLLEAQGSESEKIPLFVSWPPWLEDGIVCLYARDLHELLRKTVHDTAASLDSLMENPESQQDIDAAPPVETPPEPARDEAREAAQAILEQPLGLSSVRDTEEDNG